LTSPVPSQVINEMARRPCRFHLYLWDRVRNGWLRLKEEERQAVRDVNPGWEPPRPARDETGQPIADNDSGEDFLFMHRRTIALANAILAEVGDPAYPRVEGWKRVPPPGDSDYPVPEFRDSGLEEVKSVEHFERYIAPWERLYTDPDYLRSVTLGRLGSDIEFTIHSDMHMRWAAPSPVCYRPITTVADGIGEQWDAPAYDYLGDTYSSHVNPIFWKLHGWVDDRVEDWKRANGVEGEPEWKGTWGGPTHEHWSAPFVRDASDAPDTFDDELRRIDRIISASGAGHFDGFFRPSDLRGQHTTFSYTSTPRSRT
jgi:hypothetical protein